MISLRILNFFGKKKVIYYAIIIKNEEDNTVWTINRRYKQFNELHKRILKSYESNQFPEFPPKKLCGNYENKFLMKRMKDLEFYLQKLVKKVNFKTFVPLQQFLLQNNVFLGSETNSENEGDFCLKGDIYLNQKQIPYIENIDKLMIDTTINLEPIEEDYYNKKCYVYQKNINKEIFAKTNLNRGNFYVQIIPESLKQNKNETKSKIFSKFNNIIELMDESILNINSKIDELTDNIQHDFVVNFN